MVVSDMLAFINVVHENFNKDIVRTFRSRLRIKKTRNVIPRENNSEKAADSPVGSLHYSFLND